MRQAMLWLLGQQMPHVLTNLLICYCLLVSKVMQLASVQKCSLHPTLEQQALGLLACCPLCQLDIQTCYNSTMLLNLSGAFVMKV